MSNRDLFFHLLHRVSLGISRKYFQAEVRGLHHLPEGPGLLVGNHNCVGVVNPEIWIFGSHYYLEEKRSLKALGHDLVLKIPIVSFIAQKYLGYIPNNLQSAVQALKSGHSVLVYPGGGWESCRPSRERDKIDFKHRTGFIKLAREANVPIVPIVSAGAHDGVYIWKRGHRIAKWIGLHKLFRIDAFPIGFSFPFLFHIGPLFPFFPLPTKVIIEVLPPFHIHDGLSDEENANLILERMQDCLNITVAELPRSKKKTKSLPN